MTGAIDKSQLAQWRKYDLRDRLETHWKKLGPDLRGKIHLWVGTRDDYFLDAGVHRMDDFLKTTQDPPADARVVYGELRGHGWSPQRDSEIQDEMASIWRAHGGGKAAAK
jgi:pimeloyl-ACP methyl ester carboxylesterase